MSRSGWCPPDVPHESAHRVCQMRQDDGLLGPCGCVMHGGHTRVQGPAPIEPDEPPKKEVAA